MDRRVRALLFVVAALVVVAGGLLAYLIVLGPFRPYPPPGSPTANLPQTPITGKTPTPFGACGVTKTNTGFVFSQLHVASGYIMDEKNCIVTLKGFNWAATEFGNGVGGGQYSKASDEIFAWFNQTFHMNVWRLPLNAAWWNANVYVPAARMNYQAWIQQIVKWSEKYGDYIVLSKVTQYHNPPCGGNSTAPCPAQDQGVRNLALDPTNVTLQQEITTGKYIEPALTMWTSIAKLYANDPAVLYDAWNEMHDISPQLWYQNENQLISTIRAQNPRSLIFVGGPNWNNNFNPLVRGIVPDFKQANLVYDFHVYNGFSGTYNGAKCVEPMSDLWINWPVRANQQIGFAQTHGKAVSMSEWGGCNDFSDYNQAIIAYARIHHVSMMYYHSGGVFTVSKGVRILNENGIKVQADYAAL